MEAITQFQRYENSYRLVNSELNVLKEDFSQLKSEFSIVVEENKKLRRDLKDALANQLSPLDKNSLETLNETDKNVVINYEKQIELLKKERENAMKMWQNSLVIISQLEQDLKNLQFQTAPQTMSFEIEIQKKQEEFARYQASQIREVSLLKAELNQKEEELMEMRLKHNDLNIQIENLKSEINKKDQDRRNMIKKEYGYDDALISLQNDINDLETKILSLNKDNQYKSDKLQDSNKQINELRRQNSELEKINHDMRLKFESELHQLEHLKEERKKYEFIENQAKEEHERLQNVISQLMDEAAFKTKQEVESLRKLYNANLEKLIEECNSLETDRNNLGSQFEKLMRAKKNLEIELEKISSDNLRISNRENSSYEETQRRLCTIEREKEQALIKLEAKETELKKTQETFETYKEKNQQIILDMTEKSYKTNRELEKLTDEHAKILTELDEIRNKLNIVENEKDNFQKKLTKQIQLHESEMQLKNTDYLNKVKNLEDSNSRAMFELRQLLNMQQRMSNKWKEECHSITQQSEAKFNEMKNNFENIRLHNEKLVHEIQEMRIRDLENERKLGIYTNKIKNLEQRCKEAEHQATEATKRIAKQLAREKMIEYEKHLLESDLEKNKFIDTFSKGRTILKNSDDRPERLISIDENSLASK